MRPSLEIKSTIYNLNSFCGADFTCRRSRPHWPARTDERSRIYQADNGKPGDQIELRDRAHEKPEDDLQRRTREIKRVLHSSHVMWRNLFHDAGIHGDSANAAS